MKDNLITSFLWQIVCEWHCIFCEGQSGHICSYDQQRVSDIHILWKSSHITSFPMTNRLLVTLHILWKAVSSHLLLWSTASELHYIFCERQPPHIFPYDQQQVSDIAHFLQRQHHHIFLMTNSLWVTLHILKRWSHHILSYDQKLVSDNENFMKGILTTFSSMTNREWVKLQILWGAVSHIFSCDQQFVSDIANFVTSSLITSSAMINREWVTLHLLWIAIWSHIFLWPTVCEWHCTFCEWQSHLLLWPTDCEWHCTFCERQFHYLFSHDQQAVSQIAHFVIGSFITSFPLINSLWVIFHILWKAVSSHL